MSIRYVKIILTTVLVHFAKLAVEDDEEDLLLAQLAELHALLDEIALPLALGVVPVDVVLDEAVSLLASFGFGIVWHL